MLVDEVTPDVAEATVNADSLVDWSSLRRVDLQCDQLMKCPICLEDQMVVPKITRCGHVFCAPCVMRYFKSMQETNGHFAQKCPVCNDQQMTPEELVSLRLEVTRPPREGERLRFVLARRTGTSTVVRPPPAVDCQRTPPAGEDGGSEVAECSLSSPGGAGTAALRADGHTRSGLQEAPWTLPVEGEEGWRLNRIARLAPGASDAMIAQEIADLAVFRDSSLAVGDTELLPSIDTAAAALEQTRQSWARIASGCANPSTGGRAGDNDVQEPCAAAAEGEEAVAAVGSGGRGNPTHLVSFYQADDGRHVFMQPLFTRLLLHEHGGSWERLPPEFASVRVQRVQELSVSEDTRRRHRFLGHLAVGTPFSFVEVDLREHLSCETKEFFAEEFEKLKQQRKRDLARSRREDRVSKDRAEREEDQYYKSLNRQHPSTYKPQVLPTDEDFVPLPGHQLRAPAATETAAAEPARELEVHGAAMSQMGPAADAAPSWGPRRAEAPKRAEVPRAEEMSWGPALGGAKARPKSGAWAGGDRKPRVVKDSWEDDSDDNPTLGQALDSALKSHATTASAPRASGAAPAAAGGGAVSAPEDGGAEEAGQAEPEPAAGKKKKGRAAKGKTIRLFG